MNGTGENSKIVLKKSNGRIKGYGTLAIALSAAVAGDCVNVYTGSHAVAAVLAAKSNVTINVLPGATVTFADTISLGAGITNFKVVGDGNLIFTNDAILLTGIIGTGNEISVRGNVTIGGYALMQELAGLQVTTVSIGGKNVTIDGVMGDGIAMIMFDSNGNSNLHCIVTAEKILSTPGLRLCPGGTMTVIADTINLSGTTQQPNNGTVNVIARVLNIGSAIAFDDVEANSSAFTFDVDEITMNYAGGGITWNGALTSLTFKKLVRIKNSNSAVNSHVLDGSNDASQLAFHGGAVLYTAGGAGSLAIKGSGSIVANRDILSNKGFDSITSAGGGSLVTNAGIAL